MTSPPRNAQRVIRSFTTRAARDRSTAHAPSVWAAALALALSVTGVAVGAAPAAFAAPGDPLSPDTPTIFIAQDSPTQLKKAVTSGNGTYSFTSEGPASTAIYNGIGWSSATGYLYGLTNTASGGTPAGALVRIGQNGVVTRVGTTIFNQGSGAESHAAPTDERYPVRLLQLLELTAAQCVHGAPSR